MITTLSIDTNLLNEAFLKSGLNTKKYCESNVYGVYAKKKTT
jgi:hypothetical protein